MGRQVTDTILSTRNARRGLKIKRNPYWRLIEHGRHIGYRHSKTGGAWVARMYMGEGQYAEERIGTADDTADADGVEVLTWAQAQKKAHSWFVERQRIAEGLHPDPNRKYMVADAIEEYLDWLGIHKKSAADTKAYADARIIPDLGSIEVAKLTAAKIRKWHESLAKARPRLRTKPGRPQNYGPAPTDEKSKRSRKVTANRILSILKAALNKAHRDGEVVNNSAWTNVKRFAGVDSARPQFVDRDGAMRLINASDPIFRPLVQAALFTGARYGELCALRVEHFQNGKLLVADSKSSKQRWIALNDEGRQFFETLTAGRAPTEVIFVKNGKPWAKSHQNEFMQLACVNAKVERMGFHQLRHSYASMAIMSGMPLLVLAGNLGHANTRMVEQHYGHLVQSYRDQMIEDHAPRFGIAEPSNVEQLHPRSADA